MVESRWTTATGDRCTALTLAEIIHSIALFAYVQGHSEQTSGCTEGKLCRSPIHHSDCHSKLNIDHTLAHTQEICIIIVLFMIHSSQT